MSLESLVAQDFASGMVRDVAPSLIDPRGAYDIRNMILTEDGALKRRGGAEDVTTSDFGDGGTFMWSGQMSVGQRTLVANDADFGVVSGNSIVNLGSDGLAHPVEPAYLAGMLFIPGGFIYGGSRKTAPYSTGTISVTNGSKTVTGSGVAWNTLVDAGMLLQIGNGRVYVVESITDSTHLVLRDAYQGSTASGQAYTLHNLYKMTSADPYEPSDHYCVAENKLIWADGEKVRFTKDTLSGGPHTYSASEDYHEMPDGALVAGLASIGGNVLVFTTAGLWTIAGIGYDIVSPASGNVQHRVEKLSGDLVLFGEAGIAYWEQLVIAPCLSGIYLIDGTSSPIKLSQNVEPLYTRYTRLSYRPGGAEVHRGHYILPIMDDSAAVAETLVCRLDRAALDRRRKAGFPWSRFDGHGGELRALATKINADPHAPDLYGIDNRGRVVNCNTIFEPDVDHVTDADGTVHLWTIVTRDYTLDGMTLAMFRYLRGLYELGEGGEIHADWGDGSLLTTTPTWDNVLWNHFNWGAEEEVEFHELRRNNAPDIAGPDQARDPHRWRVNKRRRRIRFRLQGSEPATCTVRTLEVLVRPPGSRRQ